MSKNTSITFELSPADNNRLANLCGAIDDNLKTIERRMGVEISYKSHEFKVTGKTINCQAVKQLLVNLYLETETVKGKSKDITPEVVHLAIIDASTLETEPTQLDAKFDDMVAIKTKRGVIKPRNENQQN